MTPPSPTLIEKLAANWPPERWRDVTVLVAVSGGADSIALARGLNQLRVTGEGRLVLAHFNHRLRGAESDADQAFVEELGRELGAAVVVGARGEEGERGRGGEAVVDKSEESLRERRYQFLARAADDEGARYVAMAHTADDHVETVLFNILRGSGLAGVAGIPRVRQLTEAATLIRPLLDVTRAEVLEYLASLDKTYREDATNRQLNYTRNRIRHELLPLLERDFNPKVREALTRLSQIAGAADEWVQSQAAHTMSHITRQIPGGVEIHLRPLRNAPDLIQQFGLMGIWRRQGWPMQAMSYEKWDELQSFIREPAPSPREVQRQTFPGGIVAEKQEGVLRLSRPRGEPS